MLKKFLKRYFGIISLVTFMSALAIPAFLRSFYWLQPAFVFANWENYMAPSVQSYLKNKYSAQFETFSTNSDFIGRFQSGSQDLGIPSAYIMKHLIDKKLVKRIEWERFKIKLPNGKLIKDASDAQFLFNKEARKMFNEYAKELGLNVAALLEFGIPYFIQDFVFVYRGEKIPEFHSNQLSWKEVFDLIITNKERFMDNLVILDDERNVLSLGRSIQTYGDEDETISANKVIAKELDKTLENFENYFEQIGDVLWTSDSNRVLNAIAKKTRMGAFLYNGDAMFAGLEGGDDEVEILETDFHVVKPKITVNTIDFIVLHDSVSGEEKINKIYNFISELVFWGETSENEKVLNYPENYPNFIDNFLYSGFDYLEEIPENEEHPGWCDNDKCYRFASMQNFNGVTYTSALASLNDSISVDPEFNTIGRYFSDFDFSDTYMKVMHSLYEISEKKIVIQSLEMPLNEEQQLYLEMYFLAMKRRLA